MSKHTPGPWVSRPPFVFANGGRVIAHTSSPKPELLEESEANTKLIAAAPLLLKAAKYMLPLLEDEIAAVIRNEADGNEEASETVKHLNVQWEKIRAAIAAAEGDTSE